MAKKRRADGPSRSVSARVPSAVADALDAAARETGIPRNRIISEALELYAAVLRAGLCAAPQPHLAARRSAILNPSRELPPEAR